MHNVLSMLSLLKNKIMKKKIGIITNIKSSPLITSKEQCNIDSVIHWVSMSESEPPPKRARYLVHKEDGELEFQNWYYPNDCGWWANNITEITHWAEIPKPPCV